MTIYASAGAAQLLSLRNGTQDLQQSALPAAATCHYDLYSSQAFINFTRDAPNL